MLSERARLMVGMTTVAIWLALGMSLASSDQAALGAVCIAAAVYRAWGAWRTWRRWQDEEEDDAFTDPGRPPRP